MALSHEVAAAYNSTGRAWQHGPARVYDRLGDVLADASPVPLAGARALDIGAGTGSATRAAQRRGASVVALDVAIGMLGADAASRPPATVGDALALPFAAASFDVVIAAFSLNHLTAPSVGLREAARVLRTDGGLVAAAYAADDDHPARDATDTAARARGWVPPRWYSVLQAAAVPRLATVERARAAGLAAGLVDVVATNQLVAFPELAIRDLVAWRTGMAQLAPFVATLSPVERDELVAEAVDRLADAPMLVRSVIVLTYRATGSRRRPAPVRREPRTLVAR